MNLSRITHENSVKAVMQFDMLNEYMGTPYPEALYLMGHKMTEDFGVAL